MKIQLKTPKPTIHQQRQLPQRMLQHLALTPRKPEELAANLLPIWIFLPMYARKKFSHANHLQEEQQKRLARAKKFNTQAYIAPKTVTSIEETEDKAKVEQYKEQGALISIDKSDKIKKPTEAATTSKRIATIEEKRKYDTIHVYGIVNFKPEHIRSYFEGYGQIKIEYLHKPCLNVIFTDNLAARRALEGLSLQSDAPTSLEDWRRAKPVLRRNTLYEVSIRFATDKDTKQEGEKPAKKIAVAKETTPETTTPTDDGDEPKAKGRGRKQFKRKREAPSTIVAFDEDEESKAKRQKRFASN